MDADRHGEAVAGSSRSRPSSGAAECAPVSTPRTPQLVRTSSTASSHRDGRHTPIHYKHREPAPKRLFRKIANLVQPSTRAEETARRVRRADSSASSTRPPPSPATLVDETSYVSTSRNIKIRLATFNMGNSLPTPGGDLSEFLGDLAKFPDEHLARHTARGKRASSRASSFFSRPPNGKAQSISSHMSASPAPSDLPNFPLTAEHPYHILVVSGQECPTARSGGVFRGQSWTSQLENYLCGGADDSDSEEETGESEGECASPKMGESDQAVREGPLPGLAQPLGTAPYSTTDDEGRSVAASTDDLASQVAPSAADTASITSRTRRRGPYVLVEKERLMGIYCAVFVARCCEDLVEGVSKSRVTAGLIGGRVGNKGGIGISLHFASCRLLFVSAHLAAHASGLEIRKANAQKILDELDLDDFLESADPKPEKLLERFDHTFFMGDLNFRLNISRLHADWLVQAKDFSTALQFDQLRAVLDEPEGVLSGFGEAPITFPPTYKYDLRRASRKVVKKPSRLVRRASKAVMPARLGPKLASSPDTELDATTLAGISSTGATDSGNDDAASIASTVDVDALDALAAGDLESPIAVKAVDETSDPRRNARVRFLTLVKRNSTLAALETARLRAQAGRSRSATQGQQLPLSQMFREADGPANSPRPILRQSQSVVTARTIRPDTLVRTDSTGEASSPDSAAPTWDSSKKQRVQSWTDRILFYPKQKALLGGVADLPTSLAPALVALEPTRSTDVLPRRSRSVRSLPFEGKRNSRSRSRIRRNNQSTETLDSTSLWQRVKSFPALSVLERKASNESISASLAESQPPKDAPQGPLSMRRAPRRHFTLGDSPDVSPISTPAHSPAAVTLSADQFEVPEATDERVDTSSSLHGRFRSFLTSLPLPFLSAPVRSVTDLAGIGRSSPVPPKARGPAPGELLPIKYDSVMNIDRMAAVSDHRPVYLVCAVGIDEP
ncbi:hypothetical protein JCM10908_003299 [Rhodotorula pacifica]|uniref:uncharacterized protein n=1 Tax=Rhodotorula pacifica TaxID=1495444 RepID=UPI00317C6EF2